MLGPVETNAPTDLVANEPEDQQEQAEEESEDSGDDETAFDASLGPVNTGPVQVEPPIDQPVTSGGAGLADVPGGGT